MAAACYRRSMRNATGHDLRFPADRGRLTERLRLEPVGRRHAEDLWRLHQHADVAFWHAGRWTLEEAHRWATARARTWETDGVGKWMAYDRVTGELVGRGGLPRIDADGEPTRQIRSLLPGRRWARERLEVGWTVRGDPWGRGYATEIGRSGLALAFEELGAEAVIAYTERHNRRSRAVMERLAMRHVGEIVSRGLVEGRDGGHDAAPFALYAIGRPEG